MNKRKAFTLVELLVVIGIIALLAGILLPAVNHMRRSAQITGEKADFQSIESALNAYKADFGDYPRNANLPTWNTVPLTGPAAPAPIFYSLAASLMGPGPAVTQQIPAGGNVEIGDGNDGPGFRCQTSGAIPGTATVTAGSTSVNMSVNTQYAAQVGALVNNFVARSATSTATAASITFFPSADSPYQETIGIITVQPGLQLTLASPLAAAHNGSCLITQPSGKVWGPYISADTFKVAYIPQKDLTGALIGAPNPMGGYGQPVLLDRWGQVIQYFPTYGTISNRASDSVSTRTLSKAAIAGITAGPLIGDSQPMSIDNVNGQNAIWDSRDGMPFFSNTAVSGSGVAWTNPVSGVSTAYCQQWQDVAAAPYFYPEMAVQWLLGVTPITTPSITTYTGNVIQGSDKLSYSGPYILISAGPDGPNRANGGFCNMVDPVAGTSLPANTLQQIFISSGNIYNFDRQ